MRILVIFTIAVIFSLSCLAQSKDQLIKEINYSYEKAGAVTKPSVRKDVVVYGSNKNKVEVLDFNKDSGKVNFDTITRYSIVYDTVKNQVTQTSFSKNKVWKKGAEIITSYNKDKSVAEIQWKVVKKDKVVPYGRFVYSYDSLKRTKEIQFEMADSIGKFNPDVMLDYAYDKKGLKSCSMLHSEDGKWIKLSMYVVMFDSLDMIGSLMKFKNESRLDNKYYIENSYNASTVTRTIKFKNYYPGGGQTNSTGAKNESYMAAIYKDDKVSMITSFVNDPKTKNWAEDLKIRYTYGDAGHPLNNVLKQYMTYDPLTVRFNDFVNETFATDVNGIIDGAKLWSVNQNKCSLFSASGAMLKYVTQ